MYPKKDGIFTSFSSAIAFTMKFGAFPMYVFAPMRLSRSNRREQLRDSGSRPAFPTGSVFMGANTYIGNAPTSW